VFQRKGKLGDWEDWKDSTLTALKSLEGVELALKAGELRAFWDELGKLYDIHSEYGVPRGEQAFLPVSAGLRATAQMTVEQLSAVAAGDDGEAANALVRLLQWASGLDDLDAVLDGLEKHGPEVSQALSSLANLSVLKQSLAVWQCNRAESREKFWQQHLREFPVVLQQLFAQPIVVIRGEAYVGGKGIDNTGGKLVDFLFKNELTDNVGFVEVKTPCDPLLGPEYRSVFSMSQDLVGGVMQVLHYRKSFLHELYALRAKSKIELDASEPPCVLIIGNGAAELDSPEKKASFELFRRQFIGVRVVTFDELFRKVERLVALLGGGEEADEPHEEWVPATQTVQDSWAGEATNPWGDQ
jgi:hypothetical protein